ncbi:type II toxin-antitoxin system Phd/YefM family antitoxin [Streptomyces sp. NPDC056165]|uniref:type II toxin-antitoxin system Phd/YefM family antitoxin n=1 Tax=Streptomyces sp. NPDC056165 TaxID=3345733 RepID=UPI0035E10E1C
MSQSLEAQMGVSDARANLTDVIARVRLLQQRVILTRREKPQAVLVSPEFYERALAALGETGDAPAND